MTRIREEELIQIWRTVRPVALAKKAKKERKKDSGKLAIRPDHPRRRTKVKVCIARWPPVCSSIFQVLLKSVQWFCRCGWSKIALPHFYRAMLCTVRTMLSHDVCLSVIRQCRKVSSLQLSPCRLHSWWGIRRTGIYGLGLEGSGLGLQGWGLGLKILSLRTSMTYCIIKIYKFNLPSAKAASMHYKHT